jgi:hypothetical protein
LGFEIFSGSDSCAAVGIDDGEIAEDGRRVYATGAEFFFDEGEIGADEG